MAAFLLLDDEQNVRHDLRRLLQRRHRVRTAASKKEAVKIIKSEELDYAIIDLKIDFGGDFNGTHVVNYVKRIQPATRTLVLSAYEMTAEIEKQFEFEIDAYIHKGGDENYLNLVENKISDLESNQRVKTCLVIMPFSRSASCREKDWTTIFEKVIKPAVEHAGYKYRCRRAKVLHGSVIEGILAELNRADLVIADLTDRNANVFYELGVRHALRDSTVLIAQRLEDVPFDLRHYAIQIYDWKNNRGRDLFKKRIREIIDLIEGDPEHASSPVRRYLRIES